MSTETDIDVLQARVSLIEEVLNNVQQALLNTASSEALRQLVLLKERDIEDIKTDIAEIRNRLTLIENELFS